MNNLDKQYLELVSDVLENGYESGDRTGTGTKKVFGRTLRHNMKEGFPLLTSKKMFHKGILHELLWFLRGDTNIKYLVDNGVNIWVGDCYKKYVTEYQNNNPEAVKYSVSNMVARLIPDTNDTRMYTREEFIDAIKDDEAYPGFYQKWGELNKVYGSEWVNWDDNINQIQELIDTLKTNPDSRRMLVTAWNPTNVRNAVLPPCHYAFQVFTRELSLEERIEIKSFDTPQLHDFVQSTPKNGWTHKELDKYNYIPRREISLMFNMRSVDIGLGLPFDIASYGFLLKMLAKTVNMVPGELIYTLADTHIYLNQIDPIQAQFSAEQYKLPYLSLKSKENIFDYKFDDFKIVNYNSSPALSLPLSN